MSHEKAPPLVGVTRGLVYALGDHVVLEVPDFGRLEFPPDVAERIARALVEGASIVRRDQPKKLVKLLEGA